MKEYNRKTKRWETTEQVGNLKKRDTCKNHQAHDYRLCLPDYYESMNRDLPEEVIEKWYESEDRVRECQKLEKEYQESIGIKLSNRVFEYIGHSKYYKCANCGKKHYNG